MGVDEVGRGCLAGPVVTAAVVFPDHIVNQNQTENQADDRGWWSTIRDSKLLKPQVREDLAQKIWQYCHVQVAWCDSQEIDQHNILKASLLAMRQCLWPFSGLAQVVLVDGHIDPYKPQFGAAPDLAVRLGFQRVIPLVKGDQKSFSIAAASIVAKVFRDHWMDELEGLFPGYGLSKHKGYPTPDHKRSLKEHGLLPIHRRSFSF